MNVFEDLLEELKQEDLLEDTVLGVEVDESKEKDNAETDNDSEVLSQEEEVSFEINDQEVEVDVSEKTEGETDQFLSEDVSVENELNQKNTDSQVDSEVEESEEDNAENIFEEDLGEVEDEQQDFSTQEWDKTENEDSSVSQLEENADEKADTEETDDEAVSEEKDPEYEKNLHRQRLMDSVTSLQIVEQIFSGIEREQMKSKANPYDTVSVKKALHSFFETFESDEPFDSEVSAEVEAALIKETELWHSFLSEKDSKINVAQLRRYCESTNLNSKSLIALARFYRNSSFSEDTRNKFDLVISRLFTSDLDDDKRELVFERDEIIEHLKELYADWLSVPLYSEDENDSELVLLAFGFEDYITEANRAKNFDGLIKNKFFKRLKNFKRKTRENFFAPLITAAAVESNVLIGNRYVELINAEREKDNSDSIEDRYGMLHDKSISEATSKSLQLAELIKDQQPQKKEVTNDKKADSSKVERAKLADKKWLMIGIAGVALAGVLFLAWFFLFSGAGTNQTGVPKGVAGEKSVNLENSSFKDYIKSATIREDTLFAIAKPSWGQLSYQEKENLLKKINLAGSDRGYKRVEVLNDKNESLGFASASGVNVVK